MVRCKRSRECSGTNLLPKRQKCTYACGIVCIRSGEGFAAQSHGREEGAATESVVWSAGQAGAVEARSELFGPLAASLGCGSVIPARWYVSSYPLACLEVGLSASKRMPALPVSRSGAVAGSSADRKVRFSDSPTIIGIPSENTGRSVPKRRKPHRSVDMQERLIDEKG